MTKSLFEVLIKEGTYESIPNFLKGALFMYLMDAILVIVVLEQYSRSDTFIMFLILGGLFFILLLIIGAIMYYKLKADSFRVSYGSES